MKKAMILLLGIGLLTGCNSNKISSKNSGRKVTTATDEPAYDKTVQLEVTERKESAEIPESSNKNTTALDSLLKAEESTPQRPGLYFNGASGPGTGGSYASSSYRHAELNKKKYAKKALAAKKEREQLNESINNLSETDSLGFPADSAEYIW